MKSFTSFITEAISAQSIPTPPDDNEADMTVAFGRFNPPTTGHESCLLYTSPSPRDTALSRMPSSA